jgi:hypothetical protein
MQFKEPKAGMLSPAAARSTMTISSKRPDSKHPRGQRAFSAPRQLRRCTSILSRTGRNGILPILLPPASLGARGLQITDIGALYFSMVISRISREYPTHMQSIRSGKKINLELKEGVGQRYVFIIDYI